MILEKQDYLQVLTQRQRPQTPHPDTAIAQRHRALCNSNDGARRSSTDPQTTVREKTAGQGPSLSALLHLV